jgi:hypothetical protein
MIEDMLPHIIKSTALELTLWRPARDKAAHPKGSSEA